MHSRYVQYPKGDITNYHLNMKTLITLLILLITFNTSRSQSNVDKNFFKRVHKIPDSIKVDDVVVYNLFKYQILAHESQEYDSTIILNRVYKTHPKIWSDLYGVLFDSIMFTPQGIIDWNRNIFNEKKDSIIARVDRITNFNFDSVLTHNLKAIKHLTNRTPQNVRLSIIFSPFEGIGFGGIEKNAFILDLVDYNFDIAEMIKEGIPHELNHFIYEDTRKEDSYKDSPLRLTLDEGFACYYVFKLYDGKISKYQAVEQMSKEEWDWYELHEKEIYDKSASHFFTSGEGDPLRKLGREMGAPKTVFYWLGFRIIESYVKKYGEDSWLDIFNLPVKEVLEKSGYQEYIEQLK